MYINVSKNPCVTRQVTPIKIKRLLETLRHTEYIASVSVSLRIRTHSSHQSPDLHDVSFSNVDVYLYANFSSR